MYYENRPTQPYKRREHYYRDMSDIMYKSIVLGFNMETGEQQAVLRRLTDGTIWIVPATELRRTVLVNGVPTRVYTEENDYQEEYHGPDKTNTTPSRPNASRDSNYPGYANDPRLGAGQRPNFRDDGPTRREPGRRGFQDSDDSI